MNIRFVILLIIIFSYKDVLSQNNLSQIILNNGDTLRGHVDYRKLYQLNKCFLDIPDSNKQELIDINTIKKITLQNNSVFVPKKLSISSDSGNYLLEVLMEGQINLYMLHGNEEFSFWGVSSDEWYELSNKKLESNRGGKNYVRYVETYKGVLKNLVKDSPVLFEKVDRLNYNKKSIKNLVAQYHEINNLPYTILGNDENELKVRFGLSAGFQYSKLEFRGEERLQEYIGEGFEYISNFSLSTFTEFINIGYLDKGSLKIGISFQQSQFSNEALTLSFNNIQTPVSYNHRFTKDRRLNPYIQGGTVVNFLINVKDQSTEDYFNNNWLQRGRVQYGFNGGVGLATTTKNTKHYFIELSYTYLVGLHQNNLRTFVAGVGFQPIQERFYSNLSNVGITTGIRF
jgi:hypothetical protein